MRPKTTKILTLSMLLLFLLISCVSASTTITIPYDKFNTTSITYYQTDKTYTMFEAKITPSVAYNTSNNNAVIVLALTNANNESRDGILLKIFQSLAQVFIMTNSSYASNKIAEIGGDVGWKSAIGDTWLITYCDGKLSIGNSTDKEALIGNYALGDFALNYIQASDGSAVSGSVISGSVYVEIDDSMLQTQTLVYAWIPVIVTFAMLGMVLALVKKLSL